MAAAAAVVVRDQQRLVETRKRSQRANATSKAEAARREMATGRLDFAKALKALRAQRAAEVAAMERQRREWHEEQKEHEQPQQQQSHSSPKARPSRRYVMLRSGATLCYVPSATVVLVKNSTAHDADSLRRNLDRQKNSHMYMQTLAF